MSKIRVLSARAAAVLTTTALAALAMGGPSAFAAARPSPDKNTAPAVSAHASTGAANQATTTTTTPSGPGPDGKYGYAWARQKPGAASTASPAPQAGPVNASYTHQPAPGSQGDLPRGTGPVMHSATISLVFWLPAGKHYESTAAGDTAYETLQQRWVQDVGGTPYLNLVTQYFDGSGHIANSISFGGTYLDTRAYPHAGTNTDPLTGGDITGEVSHAASAKGWAEDSTHIILVFTARDIQECTNQGADNGCTYAPKGYCAYHDHFSDGGKDAIFGFLSDDDGNHGTGNCDAGGNAPNGDMAADSEVSTMSHEVIEAITDPHPNDSWTDPNPITGGEIGDKCNYNYAPRNDSGADVYLHGHPYLVQQEWSNAIHTCGIDMCLISGSNDVCPPQVSGTQSVDNPNPVIGSTVTYTVTVENSDDTGAATNVSVTGPMPSGYVITGLQAPGSSSSSSTSSSYSVGYDTIAVHQSETITVTATVPVQVGQPASACSTITPENLLSKAEPAVQTSPCGTTTPGKIPTSITYTGATTADYHDAFTASAVVSGGGSLAGGTVTFTLGAASCSATTNGSGDASCSLTPVDAAGPATLHADYGGDGTHLASSTTAAFVITREETTLAYSGPKHVANGVPATLSAVLKEDGTAPISGRSVLITLGAGPTAQTCTGTTDANGSASCTIAIVDQPLNDTATVPVAANFAGDAFYLPSSASATVRLEYYTGRSFGLSANINLLLTQLTIPPTPDTGPIRIAQASTTTTPCAVSVSTLLISADALCANVTTKLAPGTSTATATVQDATVGIPGLPVIGIKGLTATSVSSCTGTSGSATLTLTIAGVPVTVPTAPNSVIGLPGGARLVVNEQSAVPGADFGTTVNAVHLVVPALLGGGNTVDVVLGSATSDAHNCS